MRIKGIWNRKQFEDRVLLGKLKKELRWKEVVNNIVYLSSYFDSGKYGEYEVIDVITARAVLAVAYCLGELDGDKGSNEI